MSRSKSKWLRRSLLIALSASIVILIAGFVLIETRGDLIIREALSSINRGRSGEFSYRHAGLNWLKHFPDVTVELQDVTLTEPTDSSGVAEGEPIIEAGDVLISLNLFELLGDRTLKVYRVDLNRGVVRIREDENGELNIVRSLSTIRARTKDQSAHLIVDIEEAALNNVLLKWTSPSGLNVVTLNAKNLMSNLWYDSGKFTCKIQSTQDLVSFALMDRTFTDISAVELDVDLTYDISKKFLQVTSGSIGYQEMKLDVRGYYDRLDKRAISLDFNGHSNEWVILKMIIQHDLLRLNEQAFKAGSIRVTGKLFGNIDDGFPQIEAVVDGQDIDLKLPRQNGELTDIGFHCRFTSGEADDWSEANAELSHLTGKVPGGSVEGRFSIRNFKHPIIAYSIKAKALIDGYESIFRTGKLKDLKGRVSVESTFEGPVDLAANEPVKPMSGSIEFDKVSFAVGDDGARIDNLTGKFSLENRTLKMLGIDLQYLGNKWLLSGHLSNPHQLVFNREGPLNLELRVESKRVRLEDVPGRAAHFPDSLSNVQADLLIHTSASSLRSKSGVPPMDFEIRELSSLWRETDIRIAANGSITSLSDGPRLEVKGLKAYLGRASIQLKGQVQQRRDNAYAASAKVVIDRLPLDLLAELMAVENKKKTGGMLSTEFDFSVNLMDDAAYLEQMAIQSEEFNLRLADGSQLVIEGCSMQLGDLPLQQGSPSSSRSGHPYLKLDVTRFNIPGIGNTALHLSANGTRDDTRKINTVEDISFLLKLPQGNVKAIGSLSMPDSVRLKFNSDITLEDVPWPAISSLTSLLSIQDGDDTQRARRGNVYPVVKLADLRVRGDLNLDPLGIQDVSMNRSRVDLKLSDSVYVRTGLFDLQMRRTGTDPTGFSVTEGTFDADSIQIPAFDRIALHIGMQGRNSRYDLQLSPRIFECRREEGQLTIDFSKSPIEYKLNYNIEGLPTGFAKRWNKSGPAVDGLLDAKIDFRGRNDLPLDSIKGSVLVTGKDLVLSGVDVDKWLANYERSQNFDLVDVTAFVLAGPAGPVITKSSQFMLLLRPGASTQEFTNVSRVNVDVGVLNGMITTRDVAFSTAQNRIAVTGRVNYFKKTIPEVKVSVVDPQGCSVLDQTFYGSFNKVEHGKLHIAGKLTGSITNLASDVAGRSCTPFYTGTVAHPDRKK